MAVSPYDRAIALCPNDAAKLELARLGAELGLGASSEEWVVVVLYAEARRLFGAGDVVAPLDDSRLGRVEAATARIEAALAKFDGRTINATKPRRRWPFFGLLAIAALVMLTSWFAGATVATAHVRIAEHRVATLLTTPAGAAALGILEANGAELPQNLARCRALSVGGRGAQDCVLWRQGPSLAPQRDPFWSVLLLLRTLPAWPFAALAFAGLAIASTLAAVKTGPRIRQI